MCVLARTRLGPDAARRGGCAAVCGKQVLDTSMYKMSEGGNGWHKVRERDAASMIV